MTRQYLSVRRTVARFPVERWTSLGGRAVVTLTIQLLLLPVPVAGVVVAKGTKGRLILLQRGLSAQTQAQVLQGVLTELESEEDTDVRP